MEKIANIFDGKYYVIPQHQRGFSWETKNVKALFGDLDLARDQSHYMGPLIVARTDQADFQDDQLETTVQYEIEDGQQRLTAIVIMLSTLARRIQDLAGEKVLESEELWRKLFYERHGAKHLRLQNSNPVLHEYLLGIVNGELKPVPSAAPPIRRLKDVAEFIWDWYADEQFSLNALKHERQRILNQIKFVWVDLATERVNRYLAFDAINSRGLPLSEFDKIKNFCILIATQRQLSDIDPNGEWYKAITELERFEVGSRQMEDLFVAELYSVFHNIRVGPDDVHSTFVNEYSRLLEPSGSDSLQKNFVDFIRRWAGYAASFAFVAGDSRRSVCGPSLNEHSAHWLEQLDRLNLMGISRPVLAACHNQVGDGDGFSEVARVCEIYTFRMHAVVGFRTDAKAPDIVNLAHEVLRNNRSTFHVRAVLCDLMAENAPISNVISRIGSGEPKYYYDRKVKGWQFTYYFLYQYELANSPQGVPHVNWKAGKQERINTQEHILPQQHRDGGYWESEWPDEAEADKYKHRLGNLVLTADNRVLARKPIWEKIDAGKDVYSFSHSHATNGEKKVKDFTDGQHWGPREIIGREYSLLEFACRRWAVPCCEDEKVVALPGGFDPKGIFGTDSIGYDWGEDCVQGLEGAEEFEGEVDDSEFGVEWGV
ncbi:MULTISPECIES: DUF262 domain-containing protein [unclassified Thioalkalivibrio]|uniref:GmrSD restriction endonuclease domain-containing protein n=1 Tax=unclassified Thioalkalivibrio TaxID=2621013 RepID=UPI00039F5ED9|nr:MULTISPECIES: DUF262 domain-containing protein [unclassified Thioalkalivibrio]